jgi:hypothetical protein
MRYARLFSWLLFVLFFLVYLTAIKLVRGNNWPSAQQQHFIQQVAPIYTFQYPYQSGLLQATEQQALQQHQQLPAAPQEAVPLPATIGAKEARALDGYHVTFEADQPTLGDRVIQQAEPQQQQHQSADRRHHLPVSQPSSSNVVHAPGQIVASKQHSSPQQQQLNQNQKRNHVTSGRFETQIGRPSKPEHHSIVSNSCPISIHHEYRHHQRT